MSAKDLGQFFVSYLSCVIYPSQPIEQKLTFGPLIFTHPHTCMLYIIFAIPHSKKKKHLKNVSASLTTHSSPAKDHTLRNYHIVLRTYFQLFSKRGQYILYGECQNEQKERTIWTPLFVMVYCFRKHNSNNFFSWANDLQ